MKKNTKNKIGVITIIIFCISLTIWGFYIHRNEPHWYETKYVKILK